MGKLIKWLVVLGVILAGAYWVLLIQVPQGEEAAGTFSMSDARTYASAGGGAGPIRINVEHIGTSQFPEAAVVAGRSWKDHPIGFYSFQLVYADGSTAIIDTGMVEEHGADLPGKPVYDTEALDRMLDAMSAARKIVLTHEHVDHIGGLTIHPDLDNVLNVTDLTADQLSIPERMHPAKFPDGALDDYVPISYTDYYPLLPGVSLIKSPGHSPGTQIILVRLVNGEEYLFVGDIAWHMDAIENERGRPRLVSMIALHEDRKAVQGQLMALNTLRENEPGLNIVAAHDVGQIEGYISTGLMNQGFE